MWSQHTRALFSGRMRHDNAHTMNLIIRKATADDIGSLYQIECEGAARWNKNQFSDELRLAFSNVIVLDDGGTVIGFVITWTVADEIQLNNIGIKRSHRRMGLATRLLDYLLQPGDQPGSKRKIFLEVNAMNKPALQLYKKFGFTETGRRKNYYDSADAILMEKELF